MTTSLFPDVNVWTALAHQRHAHHQAALAWVRSVGHSAPICFCRFTQIGLLRMLTTREAMGEDVLTQAEAWAAYDLFFRNRKVALVSEPAGMDLSFRAATSGSEVSPKLWADAYLKAFAEAGGYGFVTFDKALARRVQGALLLRPSH